MKNFTLSACTLFISFFCFSHAFAEGHLDANSFLRDDSNNLIIGYYSSIVDLCTAGTHLSTLREYAEILNQRGTQPIMEVSTAIAFGAHPNPLGSGSFDQEFYESTGYAEFYGTNDSGTPDHFYFNTNGAKNFSEQDIQFRNFQTTTANNPGLHYVVGFDGFMNFVLDNDPFNEGQPGWGFALHCSPQS